MVQPIYIINISYHIHIIYTSPLVFSVSSIWKGGAGAGYTGW